MNFRRGVPREEPEMNLVPMIDVLLVTIIFLVVTTTYSKYSELKINLPTAEGAAPLERPDQVEVAISAGEQDQYRVARRTVAGDPEQICAELRRAAGANPDPMIIVGADARVRHQSVVNVMEGARLCGYSRITFTTQQSRK